MLVGANGNYVPTPRTSVLTVFKDGDTGAVYFKDNQGNEEPLSVYAGGGGGLPAGSVWNNGGALNIV